MVNYYELVVFRNIKFFDNISTKEYLKLQGYNLHQALVKIWYRCHAKICKNPDCSDTCNNI